MAEARLGLFGGQGRSNWIRLRTLVVLRWFAIAGQIVALTVAQRYYGLQIEIGLAYLAIGAAVIGNLIAVFVYPESKRLSEPETVLMLFFDVLQLTFLLYLTGGLSNPFALLILAPVTIAATVLNLRSTVLLGATAIVAVTLIGPFHIPLRTADGFILRIPDIFLFGFWVAIVIGVVFLAVYARRVTSEMHSMADALLATQMALAREQKLTDLGGVVAAAAHELGTPLATIKLVSSELMDELDDRPELREDAELIRDQADRCRDILRSMGRAGKDDLHLQRAPLETVVREAAEPHVDRGKLIHFDIAPGSGGDTRQPVVFRRPEIIHGLRNLVQNAVDFAESAVWVEMRWTKSAISVRISDDGRGFPQQVLGRIGDPFVRQRRAQQASAERPEYEGMGLGLFIAKTLLERAGARLDFANGTDPFRERVPGEPKSGAIVEVVWPRGEIEAGTLDRSVALGENRRIEV